MIWITLYINSLVVFWIWHALLFVSNCSDRIWLTPWLAMTCTIPVAMFEGPRIPINTKIMPTPAMRSSSHSWRKTKAIEPAPHKSSISAPSLQKNSKHIHRVIYWHTRDPAPRDVTIWNLPSFLWSQYELWPRPVDATWESWPNSCLTIKTNTLQLSMFNWISLIFCCSSFGHPSPSYFLLLQNAQFWTTL